MKKQLLSVAICSALCFSSITVFATNGYSPHGFGTKSKAMAGAGVALPLDTLSAATNPASMVHVGDSMDLGVGYFSPHRSYTANNDGTPGFPTFEPGSYDSDKESFFIPHLGYNRMLGRHASIGLSIMGNGGMNTEYPHEVFAAFNPRFPPNVPDQTLVGQPIPGMPTASQPTGIDFSQLFFGVSYARRLNAVSSFGIMPIFAIQRIKVEGLEPFMGVSVHPEHVTNNGYDTSYGGGFRIGWLGQINEQVSLGASYQSKIWMGKVDKYKGLFAGGGSFDIPSTFTLGLAYKANKDLTIAFDVQHIRYSEIDAIGNKHNVPLSDENFMPRIVLGTDDGIGFGWDDMTIAKLGISWDFRPDMTLRAGYSHGNQIIPSDQTLFNIIAPAVTQDHWTFGLTKHLSKRNELNFAFAYMPNDKVCGTNPNTGTQSGCIEMSQYEFEFSWGLNF